MNGSSSNSAANETDYYMSVKPQGPRIWTYFMIFMEQSGFEKRFMENHPDKSYMEMVEAADAEWKAMSAADIAPYVEADRKKLDEYREMMEEYKKKTGRKMSLKRPKMPEGHQSPASAFSLFWRKMDRRVKLSNFKSKVEWCEAAKAERKAAIAEWEAMSDADKAPYVEEHEKRVKEYKKNMEDFRKKLTEYTNNRRVYYDMKEAAGEPVSDEDIEDAVGLKMTYSMGES